MKDETETEVNATKVPALRRGIGARSPLGSSGD